MPTSRVAGLANIVNAADPAGERYRHGQSFECLDIRLTPSLPRAGHLGVVLARVPPHRTAAPFHTHQIDDEVFYVLSGRGVLRYGDEVSEIGPGDCITCPAGTGIAHQLANPFDDDLTYLAIGGNDPNEVCTYPDSGKIQVRGLGRIGTLRDEEYFDREPDPPRILSMTPTG